MVKYNYSYDKFTITDTSILFLSYIGSDNWLTFINNKNVERLDVETSVRENIVAYEHMKPIALDIHYDKGLVYWTDFVFVKIMRYDIHYTSHRVCVLD